MEDIDVLSYKAMRDTNKEHLLLDVRDANELTICQIDGHLHIPMNQIPDRLDELSEWKHKTIICQCRSGHRSRTVQAFLVKEGFQKTFNLTGGILAWGAQVDRLMDAY